MKVACGNYLNMYSEIGYEDKTDISKIRLDIIVCFFEYLSGDIDYASAEERIRKVITKYKDTMGDYMYKVSSSSICNDLQQLIANEFFDEATYVAVKGNYTF